MQDKYTTKKLLSLAISWYIVNCKCSYVPVRSPRQPTASVHIRGKLNSGFFTDYVCSFSCGGVIVVYLRRSTVKHPLKTMSKNIMQSCHLLWIYNITLCIFIGIIYIYKYMWPQENICKYRSK